MKTVLFGLALIFALSACNNEGEGGESMDTTGTHTPAIENVNGNIPDTINTIPLQENEDTSNQSPRDTSKIP